MKPDRAATYEGGQHIQAEAPIDRLPLYVLAGSIVPMGPVVEYAAESVGKEIEIHINPGKNRKGMDAE